MKSIKLASVSMALAISVAGCGKDTPSFSLLSDGDSFIQNKTAFNNQLDILFVIDNSGSMNPYQTNLGNNFSSFITNFSSKGYDFKIAVTSTEAYLANASQANMPSYAKFQDGSANSGIFVITPQTPNYQNVFRTNVNIGASGYGDERAFSSFQESLNSQLNAGFLRQQSFLAVIILSDEDDFSGNGRRYGMGTDHNYNAATLDPINNYVSYLDQLTRSTAPMRRYNVSAISVIDDACYQQNRQTGSIMGQRYMQLVGATDGVLGSICDTSFANSLNQIQSKIAELSTQFFLDRVPQVNTIFVRVNGTPIGQDAANGWTYNAAANSIVFHGAAIPPQGAVINIDYVPVTIL